MSTYPNKRKFQNFGLKESYMLNWALWDKQNVLLRTTYARNMFFEFTTS